MTSTSDKQWQANFDKDLQELRDALDKERGRTRPVSQGDAMRMCQLFFADGWKQFNGAERNRAMKRMLAALKAINAVVKDTAA